MGGRFSIDGLQIDDNCLILKKFFNMKTILLLGGLGTTEIILIMLIVLLLFGGKKIPELMRGLGRGVREFNDAKNNVKDEIKKGMEEDPNTGKN
jgi:sec-independent protein translocase protein TatA